MVKPGLRPNKVYCVYVVQAEERRANTKPPAHRTADSTRFCTMRLPHQQPGEEEDAALANAQL
jgi:hypothetical protein